MDQRAGAHAPPASAPASAFMRAAAFEPHEISGSRVTGTLELGPEHHTPWGVVHGGVYTTAIETAASIGASAAVRGQGMFAVGVTNTTDFIRPMRDGRVDVVAEPLTQGRTQQLWQVDMVRHDDGKRIAHGKVRLQNVPLERDEA
jgi:1,4-dihydroxy-2-naphthoyl-CoA hydrolase